MSIASLSHVLKIFGGAEPTEEERHQLVKETLLMTLARASHSDEQVSPVEVATVRQIIQRVTGEQITEADVRVAAASELYERASLDHYLSSVTRKLHPGERATIVQGLAEVIKSDVRVESREVAFFNRVTHALKATPAEIAGLIEDDAHRVSTK